MLSKAFDLTYNCYYSQLHGRQINFFTNNVQTSMYRLKQKALYNIVNNHFENQTLVFITLTVDEDHYDECFKDQAGSACIRQFLTKIRNRYIRPVKYHPLWTFGYIWRLERGKKSTKRYHFHLIVNSTAPFEQIKQDFLDWEYCQWDKLDVSKSFEKLSEANLAVIYCTKYMGKSGINKEQEEIESPAQSRKELKSRLWGSSRDWEKIPKPLRMVYNWDCKIWEQKIKENFRKVEFPSFYLDLAEYQTPFGLYREFAKYFKIEIKTSKMNFNDGQVSQQMQLFVLRNTEIDMADLKLDLVQLQEQMKSIYTFFNYDVEIYEEFVHEHINDKEPIAFGTTLYYEVYSRATRERQESIRHASDNYYTFLEYISDNNFDENFVEFKDRTFKQLNQSF